MIKHLVYMFKKYTTVAVDECNSLVCTRELLDLHQSKAIKQT